MTVYRTTKTGKTVLASKVQGRPHMKIEHDWHMKKYGKCCYCEGNLP